MRLCEIVAVAKSVAAEAQSVLAQARTLSEKPALFNGMARVYTPLDENDRDIPEGETARIQRTIADLTQSITKTMVRYLDTAATQDYGNTCARSEVVVDGTTILQDVPVTTLLFLEKRLDSLAEAVGRFPTLPLEYSWQYDENAGHWVADAGKQARTRKVPVPVVVNRTTTTNPNGSESFQEQSQLVHEDHTVGYWHKTFSSAAMPMTRKNQILERISKLQAAVKQARERANGIDVVPQRIGHDALSYIFAE